MADESVQARLARPDDREAMWPLVRDFATSLRPVREAFDASFAVAVVDPQTLVLVAETDRLVGYLVAHRHLTFFANGPVAWVDEVMVDATTRRYGVGRTLMAAAEDWGRSVGAAYLALSSRRAGDFYLALGYDDSAVYYKKPLS
jgi:GNAT superfamily N-acetyltransferase